MDEARIGTLIETIYTSAFEEDGWDSLLQTMRTEFHASQAITLLWKKESGIPFFTASTISDHSANSRYESHYHKIDPFFSSSLLEAQSLVPMQVFSGDKIVPRTQYLKTEIYCDFVRHFDMGQPMGAIFGGSVDTIAHFIFHRPPSGEEFNGDDIKSLAALAPHLNRGLRLYRELGELRGKAGLFETAFDTLGAAFLLDANGCVLSLNKNAGQLLEGGGVLTLVNGRLGARHPADDAVLAAAFAPAPPGAAPADIVLRGGAYATGLRLAITPVKGRNIPLFGKTAHSERIAFMMTAVTLGPSLQNLMANHGLTRAEAEVALLLTEGLRAPQIAAHRETSIGTVNTQLKQIYAKTGADGQVTLILKLLGR